MKLQKLSGENLAHGTDASADGESEMGDADRQWEKQIKTETEAADRGEDINFQVV